jgi:hypothetical protein
MISAAELASLRSAAEESLDTTALIQRNATGTWATVSTVTCTFSQAPILPQENPSQTTRLFIDDRWRFVFAAGTDVRFGDRIVVSSRTFEVIQVPVPAREIIRLAIAQELGA